MSPSNGLPGASPSQYRWALLRHKSPFVGSGKRKSARKYRITPDRIDLICWLLSNDWSPEQISNVLTCCNEPVSHEWIYQYVADDKRNKGKLYKHLRQGRKRYRKGKRTKGPAIKTRFRLMNDQP